MTIADAREELVKINQKHLAHADTWQERVVYELDLREERILELEMEVAYWKEKFEALKEEAKV